MKCAADCQSEGGQSGGLGPHQGLGPVGLMALIKALESGECLVAFNKFFFFLVLLSVQAETYQRKAKAETKTFHKGF